MSGGRPNHNKNAPRKGEVRELRPGAGKSIWNGVKWVHESSPEYQTVYNQGQQAATDKQIAVRKAGEVARDVGIGAAGAVGLGLGAAMGAGTVAGNVAVSSTTADQLVHGVQDGDSAYAAAMRDQAQVSRDQQQRAATDAQRNYQIAGRDERVEGSKDAAASAAAAHTQKMQQLSGAAGGGAAALASQSVQDPSASIAQHRARADQAHMVGAQHQTTAEGAAKDAIAAQVDADEANRVDAEMAGRDLSSQALAERDQESINTEITSYVDSLFQNTPAEFEEYKNQIVPQLRAALALPDMASRYTAWRQAVNSWNEKVPNRPLPMTPKHIPSDSRTKNIISALNRRF